MELSIEPLSHNNIEFCSRILKQEYRDSIELLESNSERADEFLNMCSRCKKIYLPQDAWFEVEEAIVKL